MAGVGAFVTALAQLAVALLRFLSDRRLLGAGRAEAVRDAAEKARAALARARSIRRDSRRADRGARDIRMRDDGYRRD